ADFRCQGQVRHVSRPSAFYRTGQQPAFTRRGWRRLIPGRSLANAHVPHVTSRRTLESSERGLLPRRALRESRGSHRPLRHLAGTEIDRPGEEGPGRVFEVLVVVCGTCCAVRIDAEAQTAAGI